MLSVQDQGQILCVDSRRLVSEFEIPLMSRMRCRGLIEGLEAFHAEFDNNVPTAVGGVQRLNFWDTPQRFEHGGRVFAFEPW